MYNLQLKFSYHTQIFATATNLFLSFFLVHTYWISDGRFLFFMRVLCMCWESISVICARDNWNIDYESQRSRKRRSIEIERGREKEEKERRRQQVSIDKFSSCFDLLYHQGVRLPLHVLRSCAPCGASACGTFLIGTGRKAFCSLRHQYTKCTALERKSTASRYIIERIRRETETNSFDILGIVSNLFVTIV